MNWSNFSGHIIVNNCVLGDDALFYFLFAKWVYRCDRGWIGVSVVSVCCEQSRLKSFINN